jgi:hypothetical protein
MLSQSQLGPHSVGRKLQLVEQEQQGAEAAALERAVDPSGPHSSSIGQHGAPPAGR